MPIRHTLDVSELPASALDARHPIWWGNTLALAVESTIVVLLLMTYFYVRKNFQPWPPPSAEAGVPQFHSAPTLLAGTLNLVLLLASCIPMAWVDKAGRRHLARSAATTPSLALRARQPDRAPADVARRFVAMNVLLALLGVAAVVLRFFEFPALHFGWGDNAYGSVTWSLLVLHLTYVLMSILEVALIAIWVSREGLTDKFASDATLAAAAWYWTTAVWVLIYAVVYWAPRLL